MEVGAYDKEYHRDPTGSTGESEIYIQIKNVLSFVALTPDVGGESSAARGRHSRYPLNRRLGGPQSRARHWVDDKNLLPLPAMKPQTISLVTHRLT